MSNLFEAHHQWSSRPEDQRFESLAEMRDFCKGYALNATSFITPLSALSVAPTANNKNIALLGAGEPATITNYAFGQLARFAKAPPSYLRTLPVDLAVQNLNYGLKYSADRRDDDNKLDVLFHHNGSSVARAVTSDSYDRVWNYQLVEKIMEHLSSKGWVVPPARPAHPGQKGTRKATLADILPNQADFGLAVKEGDDIAPAGLYASDHDMFAFLVNYSDPVWDGAKFLKQGAFVGNSEVGDGSLWVKYFLMDDVCGNHIVWGVSEVTEVSVRHVKRQSQAIGNTLSRAVTKWEILANRMPSGKEMEGKITKAKSYTIGATKEEVLDALFTFGKKRNLLKFSKSNLNDAYEIAANTPRYGAPNTAWGMVQGLTELSQKITHGYMDERTEMDTQAGRILEMVA